MILYSEVLGKGPPVLLIPGMLGTTSFWKEIAQKLSKSFQVILIDILGFGKSPAPKHITYSEDEHVDSIFETLKSRKIDKQAVVVGHSMGALLALSLAYKHPEIVKKLILISPPFFKDKQEAGVNISRFSSFHRTLLYGPLARMACFLFCFLLRPATRIGVIWAFKDLPKQVAADTLLHAFHSYSKTLENIVENQNVFSIIGDIKIPITIVYGERDRRIISDNLEKIKILNPKIVVKSYKEYGHQLPLQNPNLIVDLVR